MKTQKKSSSHILRFLKSWEKMFRVNSHQEVLNLRRSKCTFIKEYHIFQRLQLAKCNLYEIPSIKKITNFKTTTTQNKSAVWTTIAKRQ